MSAVPHVSAGQNVEILCEQDLPNMPQVVVVRGVLSHEVCDRYIALGRKIAPSKATVVEGYDGQIVDRHFRDCNSRFPGNDKFPELVEAVQRHTGWSEFEPFSMLEYPRNGLVAPHQDYLALNRRQRLGTWITYLNEPGEGGETVFPRLKLRVKPSKGDALFFNYTPGVTANSLHASTRIVQGEKWIITSWLMARQNHRTHAE